MTRDKPGIELSTDAEGIAHLVLDRGDGSLNILDQIFMQALESHLGELESRKESPKGLVVRSARPDSFIVGADVEEIAKLASAEEAEQKSTYGQGLFNRLEALPFPVVAAVRGTCLGGGTELALACHALIAGDDAQTEIGLPEVRLGLIPGWGGTQRLPRRVPLPVAVEMILTGKSQRGAGAQRVGLADACVPPDYVLREALAWIQAASSRPRYRPPARHGGADALSRAARWFPPFRKAFFAAVRRKTAAKANPDHYPAPYLALESIEQGLGSDLAHGLAREAQLLGRAATTEARKNLTRLFLLQRDARKVLSLLNPAVRWRRVDRLGLLGAGVMGGGIAQIAASSGLVVRMKDVDAKPLGAGLRHAREVFEKEAARRRQPARVVEAGMARIVPTTSYAGFETLPCVVEAVVENLEIKRKVLAEVEEVSRGGCLFATNTSSLRIDLIAQGARHPQNVVGMHFFNPVDRMPLVEVIRGGATSDEAVATIVELCRRLKKTPVVVSDGPGFLVNRLLMAMLIEALFLLKEGSTIEAVDGAMKRFGMPMGPFELLDRVGIDVAYKVSLILGEAFADRIRAPRILEAAYQEQRFGQKNGKGFYRWPNGERGRPDPTAYATVHDRGGRIAPEGEAVDRMILPMINEAALCLLEGVARTPADVDLAMVMGTGFPPFRGGLLRYADSLGLNEVVRRMDRLAAAADPRFKPVPLLRELARSSRTFLPA
ncbi:MAG TPA: 3-hydroxyacyl-CoA dehydrogenase NAD-binding domain-containing protein [Candidatus Polarisedimenticolia bacterium]|nr:3-hydroxyacyl-CoA dehydrogenase NAD-binding domain-containing protein [Candidatus Polarisedimenticolia bacterium]